MRIIWLVTLAALSPDLLMSEEFKFEPNYDESLIPDYTLPDVLDDVSSAEDWPAKRTEWLNLIGTQMFGVLPASFEEVTATAEPVSADKSILGGKGRLRQLTVTLAGCELNLALFLPSTATTEYPAPAFLGYNFSGNHTVFPDPDIVLTKSWMRRKEDGKASADDRGASASRWSIERMLDNGFVLATLYYGDIDPDKDDNFQNGVHAKLGQPGPDEAASIATWAWALSRLLDVIESDVTEIDSDKVAVFGHSRLGKTSLWAGASDERFALTISNNSGCGGAALSRRAIGETVWKITTAFPHWFCDNFDQYGNDEGAMPFDNHTLLALIAPRPLYVASAEEDRWADPKGEFLSCVHASHVYELLGTEGMPASEMPGVNEPVHGRIGYHIRTGKHNVTDYDWEQYIAFAKEHFN